MKLGPYRLWPRFRPDMVELGAQLTAGSVLGELAFAALLAHPTIARWIEIPPQVGAGLVLLHIVCFCLQCWLVTPRANRSPRWFHAQLALVLAYNLSICMAFVVLTRDPKTPWWMAPLLYACVTGAVQEMDASLVHLATFVLAPVATIPLFLAEGNPHADSGWSIAAPLIAGGLCGLAYDLLARSSAVWRDERQRLQQRLAELERRQLARELHDGVGSTLAIVGLYGELIERHLGDPEELHRIVHEMRAAAREGLAELRGVLDATSPEATHLGALLVTLRRLAARASDAGEARITVLGEGALEQEVMGSVRLAVVRIFQEALTNALKHGQARSIEARLRCDGAGHLMLQVRDDGRGFDGDRASPGRGLAGMRARAAELGGHVSIEPAPDGGVLITATLPLEPRHQESEQVASTSPTAPAARLRADSA